MSESEQKVRPPDNPSTQNIVEEIQEGVKKQVAAAQPYDALAAAGEKILDLDKKVTENQREKNRLKVEEDKHDIRKPYIKGLFILTVVWLAIVIIFLFLQATAKNFFSLSDTVLVAFITSTTVSVIGLFVIVGKWLFPSDKDENKKE